MAGANYEVQWISHIRECDRAEWDHLANQHATPLLDWGWLWALEESGSVAPEYGWFPQHLLVRKDGQLVGAAPLYVKTQSFGEFVFDFAWADVAEQLKTPYYPKLVAMSPLTPAIGYRFLVDRSEDEQAVVNLMLRAAREFCEANEIHGFSILWPEADFVRLVDDGEFTAWEHQHFRWERDDLGTFDEYLALFTKNQRRNIRRERNSMAASGIAVETVRGQDVPEAWYRRMYEYYSSTNDQFGMWAARYLTEEFFSLLPSACPERILFAAASEGDRQDPVALSMLLHKKEHLIGRYWGSARFVKDAHFNLCYYEPLEWAMANGVSVFDPGMGSAHKIRRGFRAVPAVSLHSFRDERMQLVMKLNIDSINEAEREHIAQLNHGLPFAARDGRHYNGVTPLNETNSD